MSLPTPTQLPLKELRPAPEQSVVEWTGAVSKPRSDGNGWCGLLRIAMASYYGFFRMLTPKLVDPPRYIEEEGSVNLDSTNRHLVVKSAESSVVSSRLRIKKQSYVGIAPPAKPQGEPRGGDVIEIPGNIPTTFIGRAVHTAVGIDTEIEELVFAAGPPAPPPVVGQTAAEATVPPPTALNKDKDRPSTGKKSKVFGGEKGAKKEDEEDWFEE